MPLSFVHLSDIHFGQDEGSELVIRNDVKQHLIEDATDLARAHANGKAHGVIVTGDIAYAGKREQYDCAAAWLDDLATAIGCQITDVQLVPGNHDIDRDAISPGCKLMLNAIASDGEAQLDAFLEDEHDREVLFGRFASYRPFAEAYNCPLDRAGGFASDRKIELAAARTLRFIGLNSALICSDDDKKGRLLLGGRQRTLPRTPGEELVVLCHHPLSWLQDSQDARQYVRSRARVFVFGHDHNPSVSMESISDECDLLTVAAGATVPREVNDQYNYTYNFLIFDWDADGDRLQVTVIPRAWSAERTRFDADIVHFPDFPKSFLLSCPNFHDVEKKRIVRPIPANAHESVCTTLVSNVPDAPPDESSGRSTMEEAYSLTLLRFFRDLTADERISVFVRLGALTEEWHAPLTHNIERQLFDSLVDAGRLSDFSAAIEAIRSRRPV